MWSLGGDQENMYLNMMHEKYSNRGQNLHLSNMLHFLGTYIGKPRLVYKHQNIQYRHSVNPIRHIQRIFSMIPLQYHVKCPILVQADFQSNSLTLLFAQIQYLNDKNTSF